LTRQEFILKILRIFYPSHKTWLVKTLIIAGLGIITRPFWEPILVGLLEKHIEVNVPNADWAGWVLIVIGLAVYVLNEKVGRAVEKPNSKDIQLFEEFASLFAKNDRIRFYKEHDFLGSFREEFWKPLSEYVEIWNNAEHEYVDQEIEEASKKVYSSGYRLASTIAKNTVPIGRTGAARSVKPDHLGFGPTPDWVISDAKEINALAPPFVEAHEEFIRLGRKKLYSS